MHFLSLRDYIPRTNDAVWLYDFFLFFFFFPTLPPGSVISEVIMVLYLRFRFQGKRMFLAQHGASCLTVPWKFYPLERELFPACVLLPPAGE